MSEEELEFLIKAGKIAAKAREEGLRLIKPGVKVFEICERVEEIIIREGARPAFPCNLSINYEAAHYSPILNDEKVIPEGAIVKLDVGAQINGYITDTAVTIVLDDKYQKLADAARDALAAAISNFKVGVSLGDIGRVIEKVIKMYGFKPIRNLGGHLIRRYELQAGIFVPNVSDRSPWRIQKGQVFAIEPFATNGGGEVIEGKEVTIYALKNYTEKNLTQKESILVKEIYNRFYTLPFNERWLRDIMQPIELREVLRNLVKKNVLRQYPILIESKKGIVTQFEHTVYVDSDRPIVLTDKG
ncbi:MAG: type II methionyl aminopeptidase [Sulfolobales archaeon]